MTEPSEDPYQRRREPPPLPLVARDEEPIPSLLPLIVARPTDAVVPVVAGEPPRLRRALAPEIVQVALAVGLTLYLVRALSPSHYGVFVLAASIAGLVGYLLVEALGLGVGRRLSPARDRDLSVRALARSAAGGFGVGLIWTAVVPIQAILIAAISGLPAAGSFGAEVQLLTPIGSLGVIAAMVGVRRAAAGARDDRDQLRRTLKWSILASGLLVAPTIVWAAPISAGLLGSGHPGSAAILRWLAVYAFAAGPAAVLSVIDSRAAGAARWALVVVGLGLSELIGYAAIRAFGVTGAAMTVDAFALATVSVHLLAGSTQLAFDRRATLLTGVRTVLAAAAMAAVLLTAGTDRLSAVGWVAGTVGGLAAFAAVLLVTGEISLSGIGTFATAGRRPERA